MLSASVRGAQLRPHGGLDGGHQQRRRNAFAGHVADGEGQRAVGNLHEVVIVARNHARRGAHAFQLQGLDVGNVLREKLVLHLAGDFQLRFQALLFLGHHDELPQVPGHGVERSAQFGKLVVALHRNAVREIALLDVPGALIELVHRARHRAAELDAGHQRDHFHNEEQDGHRHENGQHPLAQFQLLPEDHAQHRRNPGVHHQEGVGRVSAANPRKPPVSGRSPPPRNPAR